MKPRTRRFSLGNTVHRLRSIFAFVAAFVLIQTPRVFGDDFLDWLFGNHDSKNPSASPQATPIGETGVGGGELLEGAGATPPAHVPEMDPALGLGALVILICGLLILSARRPATCAATPSAR